MTYPLQTLCRMLADEKRYKKDAHTLLSSPNESTRKAAKISYDLATSRIPELMAAIELLRK